MWHQWRCHTKACAEKAAACSRQAAVMLFKQLTLERGSRQSFLFLHLFDPRSPIRQGGTRPVGNIFACHPHIAVRCDGGESIVAPAGNTIAAKRRVAAEAVLGSSPRRH